MYNYYTFFSSYYYIDLLGRLHFLVSFLSSNPIFFPLHSLGIFGFPRRTFDYPVLFLRFHWLSSAGILGIIISLFLLICAILLPFSILNLWLCFLLNPLLLIPFYDTFFFIPAAGLIPSFVILTYLSVFVIDDSNILGNLAAGLVIVGFLLISFE